MNPSDSVDRLLLLLIVNALVRLVCHRLGLLHRRFAGWHLPIRIHRRELQLAIHDSSRVDAFLVGS